MKKTIYFVLGIIGIVFETAEKGQGYSAGGLLALFLGLWVLDFLKDTGEEKLEKFSLRRFLLLQSKIHLYPPSGFGASSSEVAKLILAYARQRYPREAGYKTKEGETLVDSVLVRATFVSWLRLTVDERKDGTGALRPVILVKRNSLYLYVTILAYFGLIAAWLFQQATDDPAATFIAAILAATGLLPSYLICWRSAERWFPKDRMVLLQQDLLEIFGIASLKEGQNTIAVAQVVAPADLVQELAHDHREPPLTRRAVILNRVIRVLSYLPLVAIVGLTINHIYFPYQETLADAKQAIADHEEAEAERILELLSRGSDEDAKRFFAQHLEQRCDQEHCDVARIRELLSTGLKAGRREDMYTFGRAQETSGDTQGATTSYQAAADAGDIKAKYRLGMLYFLKGDRDGARPLLEIAADTGIRGAEALLGDLHRDSAKHASSVKAATEWAKARRYYASAGRAGDAHSQSELATLFRGKRLAGEPSNETEKWEHFCSEFHRDVSRDDPPYPDVYDIRYGCGDLATGIPSPF